MSKLRETLIRNEDGQKFCATCSTWKDEAEFNKNKRYADGRHYWCSACERTAQLRRRYGLSVSGLAELLASQDNRCAVCRKVLGKTIHIDHDHTCCSGRTSCGKCVRGVLCNNCNVGLGMFEDDPARLAAALVYLGG